MSSPDAPPTPDYVGQARAQGDANIDAARLTGRLNNPTIVGPTGTQTTTWNGDDPTVTQTLSPQEQLVYDRNAQLRAALGSLGLQGADAAKGIIGTELDLNGLPQAPGDADSNRQAIMDAMVSRSNEDIDAQQSKARSELIAAGIPMGSDAFNNETKRFDRSRNDARNQAEIAAGAEAQRKYGMDADTRRTALAEMLTKRQTPLNEITALMSGAQVNNPFTTNGYAQNNNVAPAPMFAGAQQQGQADQNIYNQQVSQRNSTMQAGGALGAAALGAMMF